MPSLPDDFDEFVGQVADAYEVPPSLALKLYKNGERYNPNNNVSPKGARGPFQVMPDTFVGAASRAGIDKADINNPYHNAIAGVYYLKEQLDRFKNPILATAAYNAGPGAVEKYKGVPPYKETQGYVSRIWGRIGDALKPDEAEAATIPQETDQPVEQKPVDAVSEQQVQPTQQVQPEQQKQPKVSQELYVQAMKEAYRRGGIFTEQQKTAYEELVRRGVIKDESIAGKLEDDSLNQPIGSPNLADIEGVSDQRGELKELPIGVAKGVAHLAGKYGSAVDPRLSWAMGGMEPPGGEVATRPEQARQITQDTERLLGVDKVEDPQDVASILFRGAGQVVPSMVELLPLSKATSAISGISRVPQAVKELSPGMAKLLSKAAPAIQGGAPFGTSGLMEAEQPLRSGAANAALGASLGMTHALPTSARIASGAGIFGGAEGLLNPEAKPEDVTAQALLGGTFGAAGGSKKETKGRPELDKVIERGLSKAVRPKVEGKRTFGQISEWYDRGINAVKDIVWSNREGKIQLTDAKGNPVAHPKNIMGFANAIEKTFWSKVKEANERMKVATGKGMDVDVKSVSDLMENEANRLRGLSSPTARAAAEYAQTWADNLKEKGRYTIDEINAEIKELNNNQNMKSFFANPNPDTAKVVAIDAKAAEGLRKSLYESVESGSGPGFKELRMQMRDLKAIEPEVSHRAVVNARQSVKGFWELVDPYAYSHIARGLLTLDPVAIATGVVPKVVAMANKITSRPDHITKTMFKKVSKELGERPKPPVEPQAPPMKLLPAPAIPLGYEPYPGGPKTVTVGRSPGGLRYEVGPSEGGVTQVRFSEVTSREVPTGPVEGPFPRVAGQPGELRKPTVSPSGAETMARSRVTLSESEILGLNVSDAEKQAFIDTINAKRESFPMESGSPGELSKPTVLPESGGRIVLTPDEVLDLNVSDQAKVEYLRKIKESSETFPIGGGQPGELRRPTASPPPRTMRTPPTPQERAALNLSKSDRETAQIKTWQPEEGKMSGLGPKSKEEPEQVVRLKKLIEERRIAKTQETKGGASDKIPKSEKLPGSVPGAEGRTTSPLQSGIIQSAEDYKTVIKQHIEDNEGTKRPETRVLGAESENPTLVVVVRKDGQLVPYEYQIKGDIKKITAWSDMSAPDRNPLPTTSGRPGDMSGIPIGGKYIEGDFDSGKLQDPYYTGDNAASIRSDALKNLGLVRDRKPRPLKKMFGNNPTEEQIARHKDLMAKWFSEYRKAIKAFQKADKKEVKA